MIKKMIPFIMMILFCSGLFFTGKGLYIPIKAYVAQVLLEKSWDRVLQEGKKAIPWPWADFWPVACLYFPKQNYRTIVVNSASGTSLAFAPGHLDGSPAPGSKGNCVILGHRETHFRILQHLNQGDTIYIFLSNGRKKEYKVSGIRIIDQADKKVMGWSVNTKLTLITCYPFESLLPGNERYIVTATP